MVLNAQTAPRSKLRQARDVDLFAAELDKADDTQSVTALARGLLLLDAFRREDRGLGNAELAERTGLTKSTVSRLTYTLARSNYLSFDQERREYRLGAAAIALGAVALSMTNVRTVALPLMRQLAAGSQFNVGLGTRAGRQMIYTDACEGDALISLRLFAGSRIPMETTAMGRAYLAAIPPDERDRLLGDLEARHKGDWLAVRAGIEAAAAEIRDHGFCSSLGDWQREIHGIAVPVAAAPGELVHVLNLGGPAYALPADELRGQLAPRLVALAREVEGMLGLRPDVLPVSSGTVARGAT